MQKAIRKAMLENTSFIPILFFAFANDRRPNGKFLLELEGERRQIQRAFEIPVSEGLCEVIIEPVTRLDDIFDVFQRNRNRIVLFHFSGHGASERLSLESESGQQQSISSIGLLPFLLGQRALKCVFLNACSTAKQTRQLWEGGLPFVIGTTNKIDDGVARQIATRFYKGLSLGWTLERAWKDTENELLSRYGGNLRGLYREKKEYDQFPWEQLTAKGAEEVRQWNLPDVTRKYLFGLPSLTLGYPLPVVPYRFLDRYEKKDAAVYFGRNRYIRYLYQNVIDANSAPLIMLTGQSGVGKSSLLEAGLMPRLENEFNVKAYRCQAGSSFWDYLCTALNRNVEEATPKLLLEEWLMQENEKPLILILDQGEAIFQKNNPDLFLRIEKFINALAYFFIEKRSQIKGKLIISYRKEYDLEFDRIFQPAYIPRIKLPVDSLDKEDIVEVVNGLTSSPRLIQHYQLTIEDGLADLIAYNLLLNHPSQIALTLQIVLTRMWEEQSTGDNENPYFSLKTYNQISKDNTFLEDFFKDQLKIAEDWTSAYLGAPEELGWVLDFLHFFVSEHQASDDRTLIELEHRYQHCSFSLIPPLQKLEELSLIRCKRERGTNRTYGLVHDALGPVIRKEFNASMRVGQRARRLLHSKMELLDKYPNTLFQEGELLLIDKGEMGMRGRTDRETKLIKESRTQVDRITLTRKRRKIIGILALSAILILSFVSVSLAWQSNQEAQANALISQALQEEKSNPTKALGTIRKALLMMPDHEAAIQARHDIYSPNEFYEWSLSFRESLNTVSFFPDSKNLVVASGNLVYLMDEFGNKIDSIPHPDEVLTIAISPDGKYLLTGGKDRTGRIWTLDKRLLGTTFPHSDWINRVSFSPDGTSILIGDRGGEAVLWGRDGKLQRRYSEFRDEVVALDFSPTGDSLIIGSLDGSLHLLARNGRLLHKYDHDSKVLAAAFSLSGKYFASASRKGEVKIWDAKRPGQSINRIVGHNKRINAIGFTPNKEYLLTGSDDHTFALWRVDGKRLGTYKGHFSFVLDISISNDGNNYATIGADNTLKFWKVDSKVKRIIGSHPAEISAIAIADDSLLFTGTGRQIEKTFDQINDLRNDVDVFEVFERKDSNDVYLWNTSGQLLQTFKGHLGGITDLAISPGQDYILSGSEDGTARLWNKEGVALYTYDHENWVNCVLFSPDGQQVLTAGNDHKLVLWSLKAEKKLVVEHPAPLTYSCYAPDGQSFFSACQDNRVRWYLNDGSLIQEFEVAESNIHSLAISGDGQYLAIGTGGDKATVYFFKTDGTLYWQVSFEDSDKTGGRGIRLLEFNKSRNELGCLVQGLGIVVLNEKGQKIMTIPRSDISTFSFFENGLEILIGVGNTIQQFKSIHSTL